MAGEIPDDDLISFIFEKNANDFDRDRPLFTDAENDKRFLSWNDLKDIVYKLANGFRKIGLKPGDCVCVASFNDIHYPALVLGIIAFGGIYTGSNPAYTEHELRHHLKTSEAKCVIAEVDVLDTTQQAAKEMGIEQVIVFDEASKYKGPLKSWRALLDYGKGDIFRFSDKKTSVNTTAARLMTSGTTGLPKAANISHYNLVFQHMVVHERFNNPRDNPIPVRRLLTLPMFHAASVPFNHFTTPRLGHQAFVMRRFELEPFFRNLERHQITSLVLVPPLAIAMVMSPLKDKYNLRNIRYGSVGAAPLDKGIQARLLSLLHPDASLNQVWGMTETSCVGTLFEPTYKDTTGSVGFPIPASEIRLVDDEGNIVPKGSPGEVLFRGPGVFQGYHNNPKANEESFTEDGFYRTGDIAQIDKKTGKMYIVDRKKELIKISEGKYVSVEGVLLAHPPIADAAVIGVPHPADGEAVRAYIVKQPGSDLTSNDVHKLVKEHLASYKALKGGVVFVSAIPKSPTGKILKRILREQAKEEMRKQGPKL